MLILRNLPAWGTGVGPTVLTSLGGVGPMELTSLGEGMLVLRYLLTWGCVGPTELTNLFQFSLCLQVNTSFP